MTSRVESGLVSFTMREVPREREEAECAKVGPLEVSCASGEEGPEDDERTIKERNWTRECGRVGAGVVCVKRKSQFEA
jgi:hypothetical protein